MKKLFKSDEIIVLAGGCFDVIHAGHIDFLEKAKEQGNKLIIILESDENIKKNKGKNRPINKQINRAKVLKSLRMVDEVIMLPEMKSDEDYEKIIKDIRPNIIAVTEGDKRIETKTKQSEKVGAKVIVVNRKLKGQSSSKIIKHLKDKTDKIKNHWFL